MDGVGWDGTGTSAALLRTGHLLSRRPTGGVEVAVFAIGLLWDQWITSRSEWARLFGWSVTRVE